jgi:DNA end-binding protein Ku
MRAAASVTLSLNMLAIPVRLYLAAADDALSFNMLTPKGNRAKMKFVDAVTDEEVTQKDCDKGYEFSKGQYVRFTQNELKDLEVKTGKNVVDIKEFVEVDVINFAHVEKTYYLGPDKGGDKGYVLLSETLRNMGLAAVAQWTDKGKQKLVVVRPYGAGMALQVLFYTKEVRDFGEIEVNALPITADERKLAKELVSKYVNPEGFNPAAYADEYAENVLTAVQEKIEGKEISMVEQTPATLTSLDLLAALKNSIEVSKNGKKARGKK